MNKCTYLMLLALAPCVVTKRASEPYVINFNINIDDRVESYPYIMIIGTKIPKKQLQYFEVEQLDGEVETFMRDCFGTAITNYCVITAAACAQGRPEDKRIILDQTLASIKTTSYRDVLKSVIHEDYDVVKDNSVENSVQVTVQNDMGLMIVENLNLKQLGELSRLGYEDWMGKRVSYVYHLNNLKLDPQVSEESKRRRRNIRHGIAAKCEEDDDEVAFKYNWYFRLAPAICVVSENSLRQKVQRGASGSPLLSDGKIIAVATGTHPLQFHYTPISPFLDWINTTMLNLDNNNEGAKANGFDNYSDIFNVMRTS